MYDAKPPGHSRESCAALIVRFLFEPAALLSAWAPDGWERSPLFRLFHPTAEQMAKESAAIRDNLQQTFGVPAREMDDDPVIGPMRPVEPGLEVIELLGMTLWDGFSDNNTVRDQSGRAFALGSFRSSAEFMADAINARYSKAAAGFGYMDFYMGTTVIGRRADLTPVYTWIFKHLREAGCDWAYAFPQIHLVHVDPVLPTGEMIGTDPGEVIRAELAAVKEAEERWVFEQRLREAHNEAVLEARAGPPPAVVAAYAEVYGALPEGWPPRVSPEE